MGKPLTGQVGKPVPDLGVLGEAGEDDADVGVQAVELVLLVGECSWVERLARLDGEREEEEAVRLRSGREGIGSRQDQELVPDRHERRT